MTYLQGEQGHNASETEQDTHTPIRNPETNEGEFYSALAEYRYSRWSLLSKGVMHCSSLVAFRGGG